MSPSTHRGGLIQTGKILQSAEGVPFGELRKAQEIRHPLVNRLELACSHHGTRHSPNLSREDGEIRTSQPPIHKVAMARWKESEISSCRQAVTSKKP